MMIFVNCSLYRILLGW